MTVLAGPDVTGVPLDGPGTGGAVVGSAVVLDVLGEVGGGLLGGPEADGGVAVLALDRPAATRVAGLTGRRPLLVAVQP